MTSPMNRKQRRAAQSKVRRDPLMGTAQTLSVKAHEIVTKNLLGFDPPTVLSEEHTEALMRVVGGMAMLATGAWRRAHPQSTERLAFELDTGCGKSESAVAFIAAVHELGLPLSVTVAATKIEALTAMHRRLTDNGVPADRIALWHSKELAPTPELLAAVKGGDPRAARKYATMAATPDAEVSERPFLLCSHEYIRRGCEPAPIS